MAVLILGASGYVGTAVATRLAPHHHVVGTRFRTSGSASIEWLDVDLQDPAAIERALESLEEPPTTLIHCAGAGGWEDLGDLSTASWDEAHAVTVRALFVAARWLTARWMDGGRIVAVTAMPGVTNVPAPAHLAAANAGLTGLIRALASELGPAGVTVTSVMLGPLEGGMGAEIPTNLRGDYERFSSLKRCATVEEAAEVVAFCVTAPRALTGSVITANGGL